MSVSADVLEEVYEANMALPAEGLVSATSGNASMRDPATGLIVIKPSGIPYPRLRPDLMVVLDADGRIVSGDLKPSTDASSHLCLYREREDIGGVIHTHSVFATAWAAAGEPIPVYLTSAADNFGGPVPVGRYVTIGGEEIAREVLRVCGHSPAVLMQNHGVFCLAGDLSRALRAAIMVEEVAKTSLLARLIGQPQTLPESVVTDQFAFYSNDYGQKAVETDQ